MTKGRIGQPWARFAPIIEVGANMDGAIDHFIDCGHADCRFPNRPDASFCAQCGREVELPPKPEEQPMPGPRSDMSRFLVTTGGPVTRLDHLGAAMSWCLAIAGIAVLAASVARIAGRIVGI